MISPLEVGRKVDANQKRNPRNKKKNTKHWIIIAGLAMLFIMPNVAQSAEKEKKAIEDLINRCFVEAANNHIDIEVLKKGFQERFSWKWVHHGRLYETDLAQLSALRERCRRENITNIETIPGKEEDPLFPDKSLDMAVMVWVFHGLDKPGPLLKNLKPYLKTGSPLVIIDPIDSEIDMEREFAGEKVNPKKPTIRQRIEKAAIEGGFELVRVHSFLPKDYIFVL